MKRLYSIVGIAVLTVIGCGTSSLTPKELALAKAKSEIEGMVADPYSLKWGYGPKVPIDVENAIQISEDGVHAQVFISFNSDNKFGGNVRSQYFALMEFDSSAAGGVIVLAQDTSEKDLTRIVALNENNWGSEIMAVSSLFPNFGADWPDVLSKANVVKNEESRKETEEAAEFYDALSR